MSTSKDLISNIKEGVSTTNKVDPTAEDQEASDLDQDADKAIKLELLRIKREQLTQMQQNRAERKKYARHIFIFTCVWAILIFSILLLNGWKSSTGFEISDKVLITLITSTTINFFGFFLLVVKYLFNTGDLLKGNEETSISKSAKKKSRNKNEEQ
jgi:hypothetical protein